MSNTQETTEYPNKIVAFLDILGFKDTVLGAKEDALKAINHIDRGLKHVLECMTLEGGQWFSAKLFSDCICVSCVHFGSNLYYMLSELAFLQYHLASARIFVRGGVSYGPHFENERMIFSEALVESYGLELRANYPRILIHESVQTLIRSAYYKAHLEGFLSKAPDGEYFLDYLNYFQEIMNEHRIGEGETYEFLIAHKQGLLESVEANKGKSRVIDKLRWVAAYHNYKVNQLLDLENKTEIDTITISDAIFPMFECVTTSLA